MSRHGDNVSLSQLDMVPTQSLSRFSDDFQSVDSRFEKPVDSSTFDKNITDRIPVNTQTNTKWGVNVFKEWCTFIYLDLLSHCVHKQNQINCFKPLFKYDRF